MCIRDSQGKGEDVLLMVGPAALAAPAAGSDAVPAIPNPRGGRGGPVTAQSLASQHADVFRRGYALATFNVNDCAEDTTLRNADGSWAFRNSRFFPAYPGYDWGVLAGWAWGASRVADYLETDSAIDKTKLIEMCIRDSSLPDQPSANLNLSRRVGLSTDIPESGTRRSQVGRSESHAVGDVEGLES